MRKTYYVLWIPILREGELSILKPISERKNTNDIPIQVGGVSFSLNGEIDRDTYNITFQYGITDSTDLKTLHFKFEQKNDKGFMIYSSELPVKTDCILQKLLFTKMPKSIYHRIKGFFHEHIHHDENEDCFLDAVVRPEPVYIENISAEVLSYIETYRKKFETVSRKIIAEYQIARDLFRQKIVIKGLETLQGIMVECQTALGEKHFYEALVQMHPDLNTENIRQEVELYLTQIRARQKQIEHVFIQHSTFHSLKLGKRGVYFGATGIVVSLAAFGYSYLSSPDYKPVLDDIEKKHSYLTGEHTLLNSRLDSIMDLQQNPIYPDYTPTFEQIFLHYNHLREEVKNLNDKLGVFSYN